MRLLASPEPQRETEAVFGGGVIVAVCLTYGGGGRPWGYLGSGSRGQWGHVSRLGGEVQRRDQLSKEWAALNIEDADTFPLHLLAPDLD